MKEELDEEDEDVLQELQAALDAEDVNEDVQDETSEESQVPLKQMMIFTTPSKSKKSGEAELAIKEIVLCIERKLK